MKPMKTTEMMTNNYCSPVAAQSGGYFIKYTFMKPLKDLNNVERARLLFDLFPDEIPKAVDFIANMALTILEEEEKNREGWTDGLLTFDFWLSLVKEVREVTKDYGARLHKRGSLFADQLFDGYLACFSCHCLNVYVTTQKHPNQKFAAMISILFKFYPNYNFKIQ